MPSFEKENVLVIVPAEVMLLTSLVITSLSSPSTVTRVCMHKFGQVSNWSIVHYLENEIVICIKFHLLYLLIGPGMFEGGV